METIWFEAKLEAPVFKFVSQMCFIYTKLQIDVSKMFRIFFIRCAIKLPTNILIEAQLYFLNFCLQFWEKIII